MTDAAGGLICVNPTMRLRHQLCVVNADEANGKVCEFSAEDIREWTIGLSITRAVLPVGREARPISNVRFPRRNFTNSLRSSLDEPRDHDSAVIGDGCEVRAERNRSARSAALAGWLGGCGAAAKACCKMER
jgi:hypothetical protein